MTSKALWKMIAIGVVLLSISGHWFNSIRGTQYAGHDGRGGVSYIAGGFQTQFQLESQIIAVICKLPPFLSSPLPTNAQTGLTWLQP